MKNKIGKLMLACTMAVSTQIPLAETMFAAESNTVQNHRFVDGTYNVSAQLKKNPTTDITMGGDALSKKATLEVINGELYATVKFETIMMGSLSGSVKNITYKEGDTFTNPMLVTYRTIDDIENVGQQIAVEDTIKIPLTANEDGHYGTYIQMQIDRMNVMLGKAYTIDAYIMITDMEAGVAESLHASIAEAKAVQADEYTVDSYATLNAAIIAAEASIANGEDLDSLTNCMINLNNAKKALIKLQKNVSLADGTYQVEASVLKNDGTASMAAAAVKGATLNVLNNKITVDLTLGAVSAYGQTAYVDRIEYETTSDEKTSVYKEAAIIRRDEKGNVSGVQFVLPENVEKTNVKFYYAGSDRGSQAVLYLGLNNAVKIATSKFNGDGTYHVAVDLWNATQDQASMASSAIMKTAVITVKDGKAVMYVSTAKMTMGTITAFLQELKIKTGNDYVSASVVKKDAAGNPIMFSFDLPSEDEYLNVFVNPKVAIMGNQDIAARIKVDYASLKKVSDIVEVPGQTQEDVPVIDQTVVNPSVSEERKDAGNTNASNLITTNTDTVKTGDSTQAGIMGGLSIASLGIVMIIRKKLCKL